MPQSEDPTHGNEDQGSHMPRLGPNAVKSIHAYLTLSPWPRFNIEGHLTYLEIWAHLQLQALWSQDNNRFSSVQPLSRVQLYATPRTAARQASLYITNSWNLLKLMSIESVMPSNDLILCHPLLLLPSILPSIRIFSNESVLQIRWPKYWISLYFTWL